MNKIPHLRTTHYALRTKRGFTLVETLVAISLLTVAIVAPMTLTTQSLGSAYYARDQITAFHLAQEAIESVRHARDRNILRNALGVPTDLLADIPDDTDFIIDTTNNDVMTPCSSFPLGACPALNRSNEGLYGYDSAWTPTHFTRKVHAKFVPGSDNNEINVTVRVEWQTRSFNTRFFTISDNLFRWVRDGSA